MEKLRIFSLHTINDLYNGDYEPVCISSDWRWLQDKLYSEYWNCEGAVIQRDEVRLPHFTLDLKMCAYDGDYSRIVAAYTKENRRIKQGTKLYIYR